MNTRTLYRPVGPQELALIAESGWRALLMCAVPPEFIQFPFA
jgi:hypothetical protein